MAEFLDEIRIRTKEILLQLLEAADLKAANGQNTGNRGHYVQKRRV